jgi:hypothetical protein
MLRHTFAFLCIPAWSADLRNSIVESFCVHARNLIEFFNQQSETPGQADHVVGAKHFCSTNYTAWTKGRPSHVLFGQLNKQISHLSYGRTSEDEKKIGAEEQLELLKLIEQELEVFGKSLRNPYADKWPFKDDVLTEGRITIPAGTLSTTNQTASISSLGVLLPTGPATPGPRLVIKP